MKREKEGYNARLDESLGMRKGPEKDFKQSMKARRDESKGMAKKEGGHAYSGDKNMDKNYKHHMAHAHHKYMADKHRKAMYKK